MPVPLLNCRLSLAELPDACLRLVNGRASAASWPVSFKPLIGSACCRKWAPTANRLDGRIGDDSERFMDVARAIIGKRLDWRTLTGKDVAPATT